MSSWSQPLIFTHPKMLPIVARERTSTAPAGSRIDTRRRWKGCFDADQPRDLNDASAVRFAARPVHVKTVSCGEEKRIPFSDR